MKRKTSLLVRFFEIREMGVLAALILLVILFGLGSEHFFTLDNGLNIIRQVSLLGIMSLGITMVIVCGEIDLSIGSVYGFAAILSGLMMTKLGFPVAAAVPAALLAGLLIGAINGVLVTYGRIPSLIVTLGMLNMARGAALLASGGLPMMLSSHTVKDPFISRFLLLSQGKCFGVIPLLALYFLGVAVVMYFVFHKSLAGFHMRAIGGNARAARAAGINVRLIKIAAFAATGLLCALAGILNLSFLGNVSGTVGQGLELDVIAAVIIGGASLAGGEGTVLGTVIGVLIIGVLRNGLVLCGVSPFWQMFIIGAVIVLAVAIDMWTRKPKAGTVK